MDFIVAGEPMVHTILLAIFLFLAGYCMGKSFAHRAKRVTLNRNLGTDYSTYIESALHAETGAAGGSQFTNHIGSPSFAQIGTAFLNQIGSPSLAPTGSQSFTLTGSVFTNQSGSSSFALTGSASFALIGTAFLNHIGSSSFALTGSASFALIGTAFLNHIGSQSFAPTGSQSFTLTRSVFTNQSGSSSFALTGSPSFTLTRTVFTNQSGFSSFALTGSAFLNQTGSPSFTLTRSAFLNQTVPQSFAQTGSAFTNHIGSQFDPNTGSPSFTTHTGSPSHYCKKLLTYDERKEKYLAEFQLVETERRRIAKELHDEILPQLSRLKRKLEHSESTETQQLTISTIHKCIDAFRDLLGELHPVDLEEFGLVSAISNICHRHARNTGLLINCIERSEEFVLGEKQALYLYRAFQIVMHLFSASGNDMLLVICESGKKQNQITLRCIDRRVESADWLAEGMNGFLEFETLCDIAQAKVEFNQKRKDGFPIDIVMSFKPNDLTSQSKIPGEIEAKYIDTENGREILAPNGNTNSTKELDGKTIAVNDAVRGNPGAGTADIAIEEERIRTTTLMKKMILPHIERLSICAKQSDYPEGHSINRFVETISSKLAGIIANHHPAVLFDSTVSSSIKSLLENFKYATATSFIMICSPTFYKLHVDVATTLAIYRITQEALNNVEKHADANAVRVTALERKDSIEFSIEDDGKGIWLKPQQEHRGLRIMKERASEIGAAIKISTAYTFAQGTLVSVSLPKEKLHANIRENPKALL